MTTSSSCKTGNTLSCLLYGLCYSLLYSVLYSVLCCNVCCMFGCKWLLVEGRNWDTSEESYWHALLHRPMTFSANPSEDVLFPDESFRRYFSASELAALNSIVQHYLQLDIQQLWKPVPKVSNDYPFLFFHQRKAGGSSIRETLFDSAKKSQINAFVPCFSAACDTYTLPNNPRYV